MSDVCGVTLWDPSFWGSALAELGGMGLKPDCRL